MDFACQHWSLLMGHSPRYGLLACMRSCVFFLKNNLNTSVPLVRSPVLTQPSAYRPSSSISTAPSMTQLSHLACWRVQLLVTLLAGQGAPGFVQEETAAVAKEAGGSKAVPAKHQQ